MRNSVLVRQGVELRLHGFDFPQNPHLADSLAHAAGGGGDCAFAPGSVIFFVGERFVYGRNAFLEAVAAARHRHNTEASQHPGHGGVVRIGFVPASVLEDHTTTTGSTSASTSSTSAGSS
jgi:hypothetical protein